MREAIKTVLAVAAVLVLCGCHTSDSNVAMRQQRAEPAAAPVVPGVVVQKPFFAEPHPFTPGESQPSLLLKLHARTDSPVALAEFGKQKTYPLSAFDLRADLSADELQRRVGLPAQLADYSDPWFVYRLNNGEELWLHFSQPDNLQLTAADIVHGQEDGYTRDRIFSAGENH